MPLVLTTNSRMFRTVVLEKMERVGELKVSYDLTSEFAATSQNLSACGSSGECLTVAKVNLGPEEAAILLRTCQAAPVAIQKF